MASSMMDDRQGSPLATVVISLITGTFSPPLETPRDNKDRVALGDIQVLLYVDAPIRGVAPML